MSNTEFQINTYTTNSQVAPSITGLSDGGFVVTWHSYGQYGGKDGTFGQRYLRWPRDRETLSVRSILSFLFKFEH